MEFSHFNNNTKSNQLRNNYLTIFQILKSECQLYCGWIKRHSDGFGSCHMILAAHLRVEVEVEDGFGFGPVWFVSQLRWVSCYNCWQSDEVFCQWNAAGVWVKLYGKLPTSIGIRQYPLWIKHKLSHPLLAFCVAYKIY